MSDELITEARWRAAELAVKPNTGYGWATEEELMSMLANDLEATEARVKELEAAPEPEWEYGLGNRKSPQVGGSPHPEARARWLVSELEVAPNFEPQLVRRRPAGPWLPVEGESK